MLHTGVRQDSVLSPFLFAIYVDDFVKLLEFSGLGCDIHDMSMAILFYADDIILLSPSVTDLQTMCDICVNQLTRCDS